MPFLVSLFLHQPRKIPYFVTPVHRAGIGSGVSLCTSHSIRSGGQMGLAGYVLQHVPGPAPFLPSLHQGHVKCLASVNREAARTARALWEAWAAAHPRMTPLYRLLRTALLKKHESATHVLLRALRTRSDSLAARHSLDAEACWSAHVRFPLDDDEPLFESAARANNPALAAELALEAGPHGQPAPRALPRAQSAP